MMVRSILTLALVLFVLQSNGQSISGNLNSAETTETLGYGNVDVYQNDKLVASVLTDEFGNFNVALDTGTYVCVVNYAGYKTMKKTIKVSKDEKADFSVDEDASKPKRVKPVADRAMEERSVSAESYDGHGSYSIEGDMSIDRASSGIPEGLVAKKGFEYSSYMGGVVKDKGAVYKGVKGALTAGEINDYAKWKLWKDLTDGELDMYRTGWNLSIVGRYSVQLRSQAGLPLADAIVKLLKNNHVIFTSRTDNTGKAELWASLDGEEISSSQLSIDIAYQGRTKRVREVKTIDASINYVMLEVDCHEINNVDIAFVVDATGSMGDELAYLKAEMNDIIYQSKQISSKLNFRFANVFYRDKGVNEAYLTKTQDFNRILSESVLFIDDQHAGGGGDYEEAVEVALDTAINSLSWSEEARTRVIFLILDAPPHNNEGNQKKLKELIRMAAQKGIRIVPVGASGINKATEYLMRAMAIGTNGTYTFLTNHSGIGNAHIEPSTDSYTVETLNDVMVRILKSYTYMPDCEQNLPDLELPYADSTVFLSHLDTLSNDSIPVRDTINHTVHGDTLVRGDSTITSDTIHWNPRDPDYAQNRIKWSYYPNPTNGILNITANIDITELFITDLSGKLLQSIKNLEKDQIYRVDLSDYTTGIYLIRYPYEDNWISGKIILHR